MGNARQSKNPLVRPMLGFGVIANDDGKVTVTVSPATNAPVDDGVKWTVQVSVTLPLLVAPAKLTEPLATELPDAVSAATLEGLAGTASDEVNTLKLLAA